MAILIVGSIVTQAQSRTPQYSLWERVVNTIRYLVLFFFSEFLSKTPSSLSEDFEKQLENFQKRRQTGRVPYGMGASTTTRRDFRSLKERCAYRKLFTSQK